MKRNFFLLTFLLFLCAQTGLFAQNLQGAWEKEMTDNDGNAIRFVAIITDGYFATSASFKENGRFLFTTGGSYTLKEGAFVPTYEFHTRNKPLVGRSYSLAMKVEGDKLYFGDESPWTRIDDGKPGALNGAWLISGRKRGEEMRPMDMTRPRKTMKILSGTRFQWIAYNTETGEFSGTGGGTYTTKGGKYTENIEFFSRDDSRVGASLGFNYELKDGVWHHSGKSSKGAPIYETWSLRKSS